MGLIQDPLNPLDKLDEATRDKLAQMEENLLALFSAEKAPAQEFAQAFAELHQEGPQPVLVIKSLAFSLCGVKKQLRSTAQYCPL